MKGSLQVLQYHSSFEGFVRSFQQGVEALLTGSADRPGWQEEARRELHTAKGVRSQFGQVRLARSIHALEDAEVIRPEHLRVAWRETAALVEKSRVLWGIDVGLVQPRHEVGEPDLRTVLRAVHEASTLEEARGAVEAAIERLRWRPARDALGPLEEMVARLAERAEKQIEVRVEGEEIRVPSALEPVFEQLGHLVRNAVDHGIEPPTERGHKPEVARLRVAVTDEDGAWSIEIEDDGRGIDGERVAARAVANGSPRRGRAPR